MNEAIITAILGFLFGLLTKFIFDIWDERRKRRSLIFTKTVLSSFTKDKLAEEFREKVQVVFAGYSVKSIHLVRVEIENNGSVAVKNQAVTVKFGENATILGRPTPNGSSEDLRYTEFDESAVNQPNLQRLILKLIQRGRKLSWDWAVINHENTDFTVEHGIAKVDESEKETDLDVISTITSDKAEAGLSDKIRRVATVVILIALFIVARDIFETLLANAYPKISFTIGNIAISALLVILLRLLPSLIEEWYRRFLASKPTMFITNSGTGSIAIEGGTASGASGIAVGKDVQGNIEQGNLEVEKLLSLLQRESTDSKNALS